MPSKPPVVPSKNALRALRRLALQGSTVIGAVGSICGVAAVSYDARQRVKLAERILDTKRTLWSVSNGRGSAHVQRMFEAAERGEEFGLDPEKSHLRRRRRDFSAVSGESSMQERNLAQAEPVPDLILERPMNGEHIPTNKQPLETDDVGYSENVERTGRDNPLRQRLDLGSKRTDGLTTNRILHDSNHQIHKYLNENRPIGNSFKSLVSRDSGSDQELAGNYSGRNHDGGIPQEQIAREVLPSFKQQQMQKPAGDTKNFIRRPFRDKTLLAPKIHSDSMPDLPTRNTEAAERIIAASQQQHKSESDKEYWKANQTKSAPKLASAAPRKSSSKEKSQSSPVDRIIAATRQQHKLSSHTVYSRPKPSGASANTGLPENVSLWLNPNKNPHSHTQKRSMSSTARNSRSRIPLKDNSGGLPHTHKFSSTSATADEVVVDKWGSSLSSSGPGNVFVPFNAKTQHKAEERLLIEEKPLGFLRKDNSMGSPHPRKTSSTSTKNKATIDKRNSSLSASRPGNGYIPFNAKSQPGEEEGSPHPHEFNPTSATTNEVTVDKGGLSLSTSSAGNKFLPLTAVSQLREEEGSLAETKSLGFLESKFRPWPYHSPGMEDDSSASNNYETKSPSALEELLPVVAHTDQIELIPKLEPLPVEDKILIHLQKNRRPAAKALWIKTLKAYSTPGPTYDLERLDTLHTRFHGEFGASAPSTSIRALAQHLLSNNMQFELAAQLLFPPLLSMTDTLKLRRSPSLRIKTAVIYLEDIWKETQDPDLILFHLEKVIAAAKFSDVELSENMFVPVLRWMCAIGEIKKAQALFDEMASIHLVEPTLFSKAILVRGYATAGQWEHVAQEMEEMHFSGLSYRRPYGFALLFNAIYQECVIQKPIAQAYDYLIHAIGYWGVVPTSSLSTTAIQLCLVNRRYDLVREWVETVRTLFPQVVLARSSAFAWQTAQTWRQMKATCQDIAEACRAIAYRSLDQPFTPQFKEVVRDSLAMDLARVFQRAGFSSPNLGFLDGPNNPSDLAPFLERAFLLLAKSSNGEKLEDTDYSQDILQRMTSVTWLNELFKATDTGFVAPPNIDSNSNSLAVQEHHPTQIPPRFASIRATFPAPLVEPNLPAYETIKALIFAYYASRAKQGLQVNHSLLEYVCEKLYRRNRRFNILCLLDEIYNNPEDLGQAQQQTSKEALQSLKVSFGIDLLMIWLRCAYELRSIRRMRQVLWAVVDETSDIMLSRGFVVLAQMCVSKTITHRYLDFSDLDRTELEWLLGRLRTRYWEQRGGMEMKRRFDQKSNSRSRKANEDGEDLAHDERKELEEELQSEVLANQRQRELEWELEWESDEQDKSAGMIVSADSGHD